MDPLNVAATTGHGVVWAKNLMMRRRPTLMGFLRIAPFHVFKHTHTVAILDMVARHPTWFGLPNEARTCVINTAHFSEVAIRNQTGLFVLGSDRGCKTLVIPGSTDCIDDFTSKNARQVEVIFKRNPGIQSLYLSRECQGMYRELVPLLQNLNHLENLTMEGWDDPVAIHKIMMVSKRVERPDFFSLDNDRQGTQSFLTGTTAPNRDKWVSPLGVQALCTLIEMHPRIKAVYGTRVFLTDWFNSTQSSRCKHNVSLVPFGCNYVLLWYGIWALCIITLCWQIAKYFYELVLVKFIESPHARLTLWFVSVSSMTGGLLMLDAIMAPKRGWGWTRMVKNGLMGLRRLEVLRERGFRLRVSNELAQNKANNLSK